MGASDDDECLYFQRMCSVLVVVICLHVDLCLTWGEVKSGQKKVDGKR